MRVAAAVLLVLGQAQGEKRPPRPEPAERRWDLMEYGPFLTAALTIPGPKGDVVPKGIVVRSGGGALCFDTDLLRMAGGWTDGWLTLMGPVFEGTRSPDEKTRPWPRGRLRFATRGVPGWSRDGSFRDPRPEPYGPLPAEWAKWRGLHVHGDRVVLSYTVGACPVLEMPSLESRDGVWGFARTFRMGPSSEPLALLLADAEGAAGGVGGVTQERFVDRRGAVRSVIALLGELAAGVSSPGGSGQVELPAETSWEVAEGGRLLLRIPPLPGSSLFRVVLGSGRAEDRPQFARLLREGVDDPASYVKGGASRYPEEVATRGVLGKTGAAYEVDTLTVPEENPWKSWMRFGGLDFFSDGRAAISTWSGDVWIVSGIDEKLERLRWRRFATGLFQPCGLRIVDDVVYALGRDQITRLRDLNGDGEADFYENFNNECTDKGNYHEFALDLHTDREGSFYYLKGALGANFPGGPAARHHGCLLKVSKDGKKLEVVATGIRAGAGICVGPNGELTASDNDGHWGPSSKLNLVRPGGYYGDKGTAHREPVPDAFDPPLCWIPKAQDNSSGSQVWVPDGAWGPFKGRLLHLSYGTCSLFHVLVEEVEGVPQGGVVRFPLSFASGIMRARFHPQDRQLYVVGIKGWSTSGARDACFQRVRWTGKPFCTPRAMSVRKDGIEIAFTEPLDRAEAADPDRWAALWWNYLYSEKYGSPDFSVADPKKQARDTVEIKSVRVSDDGRTVFLEIPGMRPVMQMMVRFRLRAADGSTVAQEVYLTVNRVP